MSERGQAGKPGSNGTTAGPRRLLPQHLEDLRRSGLSDGQIGACGFYSEEDSGRVGRMLNWNGKAKGHGPFLVLPFPNPNGSPSDYSRVKPDRPRADAAGKPVRYESPYGRPNRVYFPPGAPARLKDPSCPVLITEGEKKAAKADQEGFCCLGLVGVYGWQKKRDDRDAPRELIDDLARIDWSGRKGFICFDNDATPKEGVRWAEWHLAGVLRERGAEVRGVRLPPGPDGEKVGLDDYLLTHTAADLQRLLAEAREPERPPAPPPDPPLPEPCPWPEPLAPEAFHGLAGDLVRLIEPASEADPAALLFQLLVGFGNLVRRGPHFTAEADHHFTNEFVVLVGKTSKGRKGTSWGRVLGVLAGADGGWAADRVCSGLSSGEGLIWAVRDPVRTWQAVKEKGRTVRYDEVESDPGISDKRLLVCEPEFANVLRQIERQGNTLSAVLRQAWESGSLRSLVKNSPTRATGAHVSVIGHVTAEELRRYLSTTEIANGFGNRFLWACVKRSKALPEGGRVDERALAEAGARLAQAVAFARQEGPGPPLTPRTGPPGRLLRRDERAREVWAAVYGELSDGRPGMAGALLARAEAHVMRLAMLYALLDCSPLICAEHLLAGLALWEYVEQSVRHVFGDSLGDPLADEILRLLRAAPGGLGRNDLMNYFGRNQSSERIGRALGLLLEHGRARREEKQTGGRPQERWYATKREAAK